MKLWYNLKKQADTYDSDVMVPKLDPEALQLEHDDNRIRSKVKP